MFSKAKRFELGTTKDKKPEAITPKFKSKLPVTTPRDKNSQSATTKECNEQQSECDSIHITKQSVCGSIRSTKSTFATPKPNEPCVANRGHSSYKKLTTTCVPPVISKSTKKPTSRPDTAVTELFTAQEVEIRNKDHTIAEYGQQIEDLKNEIAVLQSKIKENTQTQKEECLAEIENLNREIAKVSIEDENQIKTVIASVDYEKSLIKLQDEFQVLHENTSKLEEEILEKQMELSSMESLISIRDSLCKDLQQKLTEKESTLEEIRQRLEMVNRHHSLALEANESIRREYKVELECLKAKMEEEKQAILTKCKTDQDFIIQKYVKQINNLQEKMESEKRDAVTGMELLIKRKEDEMNAKLEQVEERAHEKVRLCEIQYEQRNGSVNEHWKKQQEQLKLLELEVGQLKYSLTMSNEQKISLHSELCNWRTERETYQQERMCLLSKIEDLEDLSKKKSIEYENERNKLTADVERVLKEKQKYETSLMVTRDIVQVLSTRLRDSDNELDNLEIKLREVSGGKQALEEDLASYKATLNNTLLECKEYKEALINILKSKAALAKEHNRIMEHNVTLIDCLETVEKEAYREFGGIKEELVDEVEMYKNESFTQVKQLREEVEKKRALALLATEHASQAHVAAEQSRLLLRQAACELERLEADNNLLQQQIHDQQSLAVEVSLLRQENEELAMTLAKQSSIIDKMKNESEQLQIAPKSPSIQRKTYKVGKENAHILISPLRERNH